MNAVSNAFLAFGILLSPATQFRLDSSAIGPGELCLAAFVAIEGAREIARLGPPLTPALSSMLLFWALFALAQSLGSLVGMIVESSQDRISASHDTVAYGLVAIVSCLSVALPDAPARLRQVTWILVVAGNVALAIQLAEGMEMFNLFHTDPYEWDRLRGWSENSNGLALISGALVVLPLYLVEATPSLLVRLLAPALAILPAIVGVLTKSDAFTLFLLTVGPLFIGIKLWAWLRMPERLLTFRVALAGLLLLMLPLVVALAIPTLPLLVSTGEQIATDMYDENHQGEDRIRLWSEAYERGLYAAGMGMGPGAHIVTGKTKRQTPPNFEAHNTVLDLFTQGGVFAVLLFVWLVVGSFVEAARGGSAALATLAAGLVVFGMFHLIIRHPIFWFGMALCLLMPEAATSPARRSSTQQAAAGN